MNAQKKLLLALVVLILTVFAGAVGYYWLGLDFLESTYLSVITITTLGMRDVGNLGVAGKIWTMIVVSVGFAVAAFAFSYLLAVITSGELQRVFGRRQLENKIKSMKNHYIICGYGRMGSIICDNLAKEKVPFVVIENDPNKTQLLEQKQFLYLLDNATEEHTLIGAGIERAKALIAVLGSDSDNVYVTLTARGLNDKIQIVARSESGDTEKNLIRAGANRVVSPHHIGAMRITNILLHPAIVEFVDVAARDVELQVDEIEIAEDSELIDKPLKDSKLREKSGLIVVIKRKDGTVIFSPTAGTIIKQGDLLITIGKRGQELPDNLS